MSRWKREQHRREAGKYLQHLATDRREKMADKHAKGHRHLGLWVIALVCVAIAAKAYIFLIA